MKKLCIYHANCTDGFTAALAVYVAYGPGMVDFHPANYGETSPDCTGRDVIIVDFSYPLEDMKRIYEQSNSLLLFDHHKTALEVLGEWAYGKDGIVLDMKRSGALIAWEQFFMKEDIPEVVRHVSDRDLWKFEMEGTREIHVALSAYPFDFDVWDDLINQRDRLIAEGRVLLAKFNKDLDALLESCQMELVIDGHRVPAANLPFLYASEGGNRMGDGNPFAACFTVRKNGVSFSLRSPNDGLDVSEIARKFGGGGHKNAAGFSVTHEVFNSFLA